MIDFNNEFHLTLMIMTFTLNYVYFFKDLSLSKVIIIFLISLLVFRLPDIDHYNSSISNKHPLISKIIRIIVEKRGMLHSPVFLFIITVMFYTVCSYFNFKEGIYGLLIGYGSHLFGDLLTSEGIPLFWPFKIPFTKSKKVSIPIINLSEKTAKLFCIFLFVYLLYRAF